MEALRPDHAQFVVERPEGEQLVRCYQSEIGLNQLEEASQYAMDLDISFTLVADRYSTALQMAARRMNGQIATLNAFLKGLIEIDDDLESMSELRRGSHHDTDYLPLGCDKRVDWGESGVVLEPHGDIGRYVQSWIDSEDQQQLAVLGDFGSGKSWFCLEQCKVLMDKIEHREPCRLPLLVHLNKVGVKTGGSVDMLQHIQQLLGIEALSEALLSALLQNGRLLLILDGFDELSTHPNFTGVEPILNSISKLTKGKSKLIITSRREFFVDGTSESIVLNQEAYRRDALRFEIIYLKPYTPDQIKARVQARFPNAVDRYMHRIENTPNLIEITTRPIVLDMVLDIIVQTPEEEQLTLSGIYDRCTRTWLQEASRPGSPLEEPQRLALMSKLAWLLYSSQDRTATLNDLSQLIEGCVKEIDASFMWDISEGADFDGTTRRETLLIRDTQGNYRFAHRSFMEYFVALRLLEEFAGDRDDLFGEAHITAEVAEFMIHSDNAVSAPRLLSWLQRPRRSSNQSVGRQRADATQSDGG